jgi:hypothetical protein
MALTDIEMAAPLTASLVDAVTRGKNMLGAMYDAPRVGVDEREAADDDALGWMTRGKAGDIPARWKTEYHEVLVSLPLLAWWHIRPDGAGGGSLWVPRSSFGFGRSPDPTRWTPAQALIEIGAHRQGGECAVSIVWSGTPYRSGLTSWRAWEGMVGEMFG